MGSGCEKSKKKLGRGRIGTRGGGGQVGWGVKVDVNREVKLL